MFLDIKMRISGIKIFRNFSKTWNAHSNYLLRIQRVIIQWVYYTANLLTLRRCMLKSDKTKQKGQVSIFSFFSRRSFLRIFICNNNFILMVTNNFSHALLLQYWYCIEIIICILRWFLMYFYIYIIHIFQIFNNWIPQK